jgi:chromosome segregation ATPase
MIIAITTVAALAAIVFGVIQTNKLKQVTEDLSNKEAANKILRSHMTNVESEIKASNDYIKTLRSELQSCTDKAKAAKAKAQGSKVTAPKVEKAPAALKAATKTKRPYKKKAD